MSDMCKMFHNVLTILTQKKYTTNNKGGGLHGKDC